MNINLDELKKTLEKLQQIKEAVKHSNHDALSVDPDCDFEPDAEALEAWFKSYDIPLACDDTDLPEEYWSSIFNADEVDDEQYEQIIVSEEYKNLLAVYSDVYSDIYTACMEECAYYEREAQDHERYLDSMRGPL